MTLTTIFIGASFVALIVIGAYISDVFRRLGASEETLSQKIKQAAIDKKRADIMAEARTDDETINRLDDGSF